MKKYLFVIFYLLHVSLFAQQINKQLLKVGNKLKISACAENKPEFVGIELYSRNVMYDKSNVDTLTGKGLTAAFFDTKNLDGKRLPCSMGGRTYFIASVDTFTDKNQTHTVVLLYDYFPLNLLLIDYETAIQNNEIETISARQNTKKTVVRKKKKK